MWMENESRRIIIWLSGLKPLFCKISMKWMVLVNWLRKKKMSTSCKPVMCSRLWGWGVKGGRGKAQFRRQLTFRGFNYVVVCRYSSLFAALHYPAGRVNDIFEWRNEWGFRKNMDHGGRLVGCTQFAKIEKLLLVSNGPLIIDKNPLVIYLLLIWKNRAKNRGSRTG